MVSCYCQSHSVWPVVSGDDYLFSLLYLTRNTAQHDVLRDVGKHCHTVLTVVLVPLGKYVFAAVRVIYAWMCLPGCLSVHVFVCTCTHTCVREREKKGGSRCECDLQ